jgi:chloride channel protein, CIC family
VIGGLFGGAFGRAAQMLLPNSHIEPGAFALVAMGTFYGGISHTPLSSLVLVCELAGSYDLLVPLMLAEGIAFVALRRRSLYRAQLPTQRDSPAHQRATLDVLRSTRVGSVMRMVSVSGVPIAAPLHSVRTDADLRTAAETMLNNKLREIQVVDTDGNVVGLLDEADISRFYLRAADEQQQPKPPPDPDSPSPSSSS